MFYLRIMFSNEMFKIYHQKTSLIFSITLSRNRQRYLLYVKCQYNNIKSIYVNNKLHTFEQMYDNILTVSRLTIKNDEMSSCQVYIYIKTSVYGIFQKHLLNVQFWDSVIHRKRCANSEKNGILVVIITFSSCAPKKKIKLQKKIVLFDKQERISRLSW